MRAIIKLSVPLIVPPERCICNMQPIKCIQLLLHFDLSSLLIVPVFQLHTENNPSNAYFDLLNYHQNKGNTFSNAPSLHIFHFTTLGCFIKQTGHNHLLQEGCFHPWLLLAVCFLFVFFKQDYVYTTIGLPWKLLGGLVECLIKCCMSR